MFSNLSVNTGTTNPQHLLFVWSSQFLMQPDFLLQQFLKEMWGSEKGWCSFLQGAIKTWPGWVPTRGSCVIFSHHTVESLPPTANSVLFVFLTYKPFAFQDSQSTAFTWSSQKTAHFLWKHCSLSNHELFTYPTCQASKSTSDFFPWWRRKTFSIFMCISFGQCKKVSRGVQKCWRI